MTVGEVLTAARALLNSPQRWTQGTFAKDDRGNAIYVLATGACSFCIAGAVRWAVGEEKEWLALTKAAMAVLEVACGERVAQFNDRQGRTYAEVIDALDRAIEGAGETT